MTIVILLLLVAVVCLMAIG
ncbi:Protein of unknown function [Propionibacterium freudenreichii]|nr:Protein of unknown function [Propionibacterium freudenreichii]